jgi:hypothetical protein
MQVSWPSAAVLLGAVALIGGLAYLGAPGAATTAVSIASTIALALAPKLISKSDGEK